MTIAPNADIMPPRFDVNILELPSDAGRAYSRPWFRMHERAGLRSQPDTGDVSINRLAGIRQS